jgi:serine/threonine-protein kinase
MSLLTHHSKTAPLPPSTLCEDAVPADLDALVIDCLAKAPTHRPASADLLWERLDNIRTDRQWDQRRAKNWWELHEPDLLGKP